MHTLHLIQTPCALQPCLTYLKEHDGILLMQDAVVCPPPDHALVYILEEDITMRGLPLPIAPHVQLISYSLFVDLCTQFHHTLAWN